MKVMKKTICVILSLALILTVFVVTMGSNTTKAQFILDEGEPVKASYSNMLQPQSKAGTTLYCPGFLQGENSESYFFLYNPGGTEMEVELSFYDMNGILVIIIIIIIIIIIKINPWQWGVEFNSGSIEICADGPLMGNMVSFETDDPETTYSVPLSAQTATTLYCPRFVQPTPDAYTECFLQNPNDDPAPTTIIFYDDFGNVIGTGDESIEPHATLNFVPSDYGIEETSGSYKIQSLSGGLVGTTIERNEFGKASAIPLITPSSSATLYCTEFVQSEDVKTYICLNNINDYSVSTTCNFFDENGGTISFATLNLDANANIMFEPVEFGITHDKGNVVIHTEYGEVIGSSTIFYESSGAISSTVLGTAEGTTLISPGAFQTEHFDAYFQVQNPNDFPITVDIEFFDLDGNPLEGYVDQPIDAHGTINLQPHFPPSEVTEFGAKIISNFIIIVIIIIIIIIVYDGDWDGDGVSNFAEINIYHTNPWDPDTDDDGMPDGYEVKCMNDGGYQDPRVRNDRFAMLIAGGYNQPNNHARYWNDLVFMYNTLTNKYWYTASNIYVFYADGNLPTSSNCHDYYNCYSTPSIIDYSATNANLQTVCTILNNNMDNNDFLYVWATDHGGQAGGGNVKLYLWGETIQDTTFAGPNYIGKIANYAREAFVFEQCYSGGFINDLSGNNRVISTACMDNEYSWSCDTEGYYDEFVYHHTSALNKATPGGTPVNADTDGNGIISQKEAFNYAASMDSAPETPWFDDNGDGVGHSAPVPNQGDGNAGGIGDTTYL